MRFQIGISLREMLTPKEASVCRKGGWMYSFQYAMLLLQTDNELQPNEDYFNAKQLLRNITVY